MVGGREVLLTRPLSLLLRVWKLRRQEKNRNKSRAFLVVVESVQPPHSDSMPNGHCVQRI